METNLVDLANAGDVPAAIQVILRHESAGKGDEPELRFGYEKVRIIPKKEPGRRIYGRVPRRLWDVPKPLVETFTKLAAGELPWPLYIHGPVGTGKTFAALAFSDIVHLASYTTVEQMCDAVMKDRPVPWLDRAGEFGEDDHPHVLFVDELGEREKVGDLQYTTVKQALDYREFRCNRVGVWISNLSPDGLAQLYDFRIASRLTAGTVFELTGSDRRTLTSDE